MFLFFFSTCILVRYVYCIRHDTQPGKIFVPRTRRQKKIFKIRKQKTDLYIHSPLSPITTTFASYSRSFAILLACCERRRMRFNTLHPFPTIPLSSLREGRILSSAYVSFFRSGHRWCTEHTCSDIATWRCMFMTFGVDFTFFLSGRVLRANDFARYTYAVALFFIFFLWSLCLGFCFTGAGMDIIFKDLEAETIHVCIAWALLNILGCFLLLCYLLSPFTDCFSVHGIWGLVNNTSLPLVCGWLGLVAKPWDAELFLFELDILGGLSRCASLDHYAL